ncbi:hypothetical protein SAMD00023353_7100470 [Rosellinia necatrix]|uniref:Uncharacterized protein n=1 Tax=Rosellinia necatrix TaxID=77044 RepID=A0A1W2TT87_ROSNE|nr:hypothetical protein SAMD00023353_7100470 [Rosellinia necatrix]
MESAQPAMELDVLQETLGILEKELDGLSNLLRGRVIVEEGGLDVRMLKASTIAFFQLHGSGIEPPISEEYVTWQIAFQLWTLREISVKKYSLRAPLIFPFLHSKPRTQGAPQSKEYAQFCAVLNGPWVTRDREHPTILRFHGITFVDGKVVSMRERYQNVPARVVEQLSGQLRQRLMEVQAAAVPEQPYVGGDAPAVPRSVFDASTAVIHVQDKEIELLTQEIGRLAQENRALEAQVSGLDARVRALSVRAGEWQWGVQTPEELDRLIERLQELQENHRRALGAGE